MGSCFFLVIYNFTPKLFSRGIDYDNYSPRHRNNDLRSQLGITDKTTFLYVGRISNEKDLDILSISYTEIQLKYKQQVALIITGDGPYMKKCKKLFPDDTIYTGFKTGRELSELYASCDIFVCPSSTETFGNVVLEAMASQIAVIGADAGGVGEIIEDSVTGLKFTKRNSEELYQCMEELLCNTKLREKLKKNGRAFSLTRSWNAIFDGLSQIYHQVLTQSANN